MRLSVISPPSFIKQPIPTFSPMPKSPFCSTGRTLFPPLLQCRTIRKRRVRQAAKQSPHRAEFRRKRCVRGFRTRLWDNGAASGGRFRKPCCRASCRAARPQGGCRFPPKLRVWRFPLWFRPAQCCRLLTAKNLAAKCVRLKGYCRWHHAGQPARTRDTSRALPSIVSAGIHRGIGFGVAARLHSRLNHGDAARCLAFVQDADFALRIREFNAVFVKLPPNIQKNR